MSMHRLSAGAGYTYLLRHTASGDVQRASYTPLTAYYAESGYPPGRWMGGGLASVGLATGDTVAEEQMVNLYGAGRHPHSGEALGRAYRQYTPAAERIRQRFASLPVELSAQDRAALTEQITSMENRRPTPHAVAGFDLTFTVPKSVSVLWAVANPEVQAAIAEAHRAAVADALGFFEDRALFTRTGTDGCAQVRTGGMLATAFDHWDTRTGDPNLHTHVVVANKVQGPDGQWRALDSRALHHATVAVSELYDDLIADHLTARLPVSWGWRDRGERRTPAFELDGIPDGLLATFSTRSVQVDNAMRDRLKTFTEAHGRSPNRVEVLKLRQQATRASRPAKTLIPLPELMTGWQARAQEQSGQSVEELTGRVLQGSGAVVRFADVPAEVLDQLAGTTLDAVMERRATWTPWNVASESFRATRGLRMASTGDRLALADAVTAALLEECVPLDPPQPVPLPAAYVDEDGRSVFSRPGERKFSHPRILDAEQRLIDAHSRLGARVVPKRDAAWAAATADVAGQAVPVPLAPDQVEAVVAIATSGRALEVLVGPAGSGKTTTLCALRTVWETEHGRGSVIGLAPSATAAHELAASLSIPCENTSKWLHETQGQGAERRQAQLARLRAEQTVGQAGSLLKVGEFARAQQQAERWRMHPEQLLIVDEASLASTLDLDQLRQQAQDVGAKIVLVGDHRQLASVDAGGAFGLLADHGTPLELQSLWRFRHRWEAAATRQLRRGDSDVLDRYLEHDRISDGPAEVMIEAAYQAWQASEARGEAALLVAADSASVTELNRRAHQDRVDTGHVQPEGITLSDGTQAGAGDRIVTRRNDRRLHLPKGGHVRNGALWTVLATGPDGSLTVTPSDPREGDGSTATPPQIVTLPGPYVREHVDLGYATSTHRAQGLTVDTSHVLVSPGMAREAFYVAMTHGREQNHAYVATDGPDPVHDEIPDQQEVRGPRQVLEGVLARTGAELSATQTLEKRERQATALPVLLPIRDTLTSHADQLRCEPELRQSALNDQQTQAVLGSPARGALFAALRRGEHAGLPISTVLAEAIGSRPLDGDTAADDLAAVLHERVSRLVHEHPTLLTPAATQLVVSAGHGELLTAIGGYDALIQQRLADTVTRTSNDFDEQAWRARIDATDAAEQAERIPVPQP